jgi:hypothetical protein
VIDSAPWAARGSHTSVIDAAGAIYVIGGAGGGTNYKDVWVSTDKGAEPDSVPRRSGAQSRATTYRWVHERTWRGVGVFRACSEGRWALGGTRLVLCGY